MLGNTTLVEHGITTEQSDIRAHVGVEAGIVFVFSTQKARITIEKNIYPAVPVYSLINGHSVKTATGYKVPVRDLAPIEVQSGEIIHRVAFRQNDTTSAKGRKAQSVVEELLRLGRFPLPVHPIIVRDVEMQHSGFDLIVRGRWHIEVKCDWRAGQFDPLRHNETLRKKLTGNIFLQTHECNPLGQW